MNFEEMIQRAVNAEAKAGLRSSIRESDICCSRGHHLFHNTSSKVQTQGTTIKEPYTEESRPIETKLTNDKTPTLPCSNDPAKRNCEKKKQE